MLPIHCAASLTIVDCVAFGSCDLPLRTLVSAGFDINHSGEQAWTALHQAVSASSLWNIKVMVKELGASVRARDRNGMQALDIVATAREVNTSLTIVKFLLKRGADPATALQHAVGTGRPVLLNALLAHMSSRIEAGTIDIP